VFGEGAIDEFAAAPSQSNYSSTPVHRRGRPRDQAGADEPIEALGHSARRHHRVLGKFVGCAFVGVSRPSECGQYIELAFGQTMLGVNDGELVGEVFRQAVQSADDALRSNVDVGAFTSPFGLDTGNAVVGFSHDSTIASWEAIVASVEAKLRWVAVTGIAPIAWGSNYYVTRQFLPAGYPLYGAVLRALPAGWVLLAIARARPRGSWWWRSIVLGILNVGAFFVLVYESAQLLPSSIASTLMALSAPVMMVFAWALLAERPRLLSLFGALIGLIGVAVMLLTGTAGVSPWGVLASVTAMLMSSAGYILTKKWGRDVDTVALTAWQLIAGGVILIPIAMVSEGAFPRLAPSAVLGFGYVSLIATALAFTAWFAGLRHLNAETVGLIGLLNPVTGVLLGSLVAAESFGLRDAVGVALVVVGVAIGQHRTTREGLSPELTPLDVRACSPRLGPQTGVSAARTDVEMTATSRAEESRRALRCSGSGSAGGRSKRCSRPSGGGPR
jgi:probable blue pigment (indigoidine) exporter